MITTIQELTQKANLLKSKREQRDAMYEAYKQTADPVEGEINELNTEILEGFRALGLNNIRLETGENYTRAVKRGLEIINEIEAMKWAVENRAISINKILVAQKLKEATEAPQGFSFIEREEVRVTKPQKHEGE